MALIAHEEWFVNAADPTPEIPALFTRMSVGNVIAVSTAVLVLVVLITLDRIVARRRPFKRFDARVRRLADWGPTILGLSVAASLWIAALQRAVFAPNLVVPDTKFATIIVAVELLSALFLALGLFTRLAAFAILATVIVSWFWFPARVVWENAVFLGAAVFLLIWGRGRLSLGSFFSRFIATSPGHLRPAATVILRGTLAVSLVALGFMKLVRPDLHLALLALFPTNPLTIFNTALGTSLSRDWYVFLLALVEIALGLLVWLRVFVRPVAVVVFAGMLSLAVFFGIFEFWGHVPFAGSLAVLFILGKGNDVEE